MTKRAPSLPERISPQATDPAARVDSAGHSAAHSPLREVVARPRSFGGLDLTRWLLALNCAWVGYDFTVLAPWFGRWNDGFTPTTDTLAEQILLPRAVLSLLPTFWHVSGWLPPALLITSSFFAIAAGLRRSRFEGPALWLAAFLLLAVILRYPRLYSQADWWLFYCLVFANLARNRPSPWAVVWRLQCVAVYFFAGINKWMEPAWRTGDAVRYALYIPFAAFPRAESFAHLPAWVYFALAVATIGQRVGISWLLFLPDGTRSLFGWVRRASALSFALMHVSYMLLLDVGTFSTVGLACLPGLLEDPRKQVGEIDLGRRARKLWLAVATACAVFFAAPLHWIPRPAWISADMFDRVLTIAPRWDMFVRIGSEQVVMRYRVLYGADGAFWYDPMLGFLRQNPYGELHPNPFRWNGYLWNWRLRLWIENLIGASQDLTTTSPRPALVQRFSDVMFTEFSPPELEGEKRERAAITFFIIDR